MTKKAYLYAWGCGILFFCNTEALMAQECRPSAHAFAAEQRFIEYRNGTVTDTQTNLMWKQCLEGQDGKSCAGKAKRMTWEFATQQAQQADNKRFAGQSGWRLPTVRELGSIVERQCQNPAVNLAIFPQMPAQSVWSSDQSDPNAWSVDFTRGQPFASFKAGGKYVRLVRDAR